MIFCNLFNVRPYAQQLYELVRECLFDEQLDVRIAASTTLSGFYQCGYIQITSEDMVGHSDNYFYSDKLLFDITDTLSSDEQDQLFHQDRW